MQMVVESEDGQGLRRLDQWLVAKTGLSRATIRRLFDAGAITANCPLKLNRMPPQQTLVSVAMLPPVTGKLLPEDIALDIIYEDEHVIFLHKVAGMVVHPAPGHPSGTLLNALLHHCPQLHQTTGGGQRPGLVHRLDKGTSGVMVAAKTHPAHEGLVALFASHAIERSYLALAQLGRAIPPVGRVESLIGRHPKNRLKMSSRVSRGRQAVTHYRVIRRHQGFQLLELKLQTGRTHQIRVHLSEQLGIPILCDPLYGNPPQQRQGLSHEGQELLRDYPHPLLHAQMLGLVHPITQKYLSFAAPPPAPFKQVMEMEQ